MVFIVLKAALFYLFLISNTTISLKKLSHHKTLKLSFCHYNRINIAIKSKESDEITESIENKETGEQQLISKFIARYFLLVFYIYAYI
jgi:hypothetical protein